MRAKYSMFGIVAIIALVISFIVPGNMANPAPASADAGVCKWNYIDMPGSTAWKNDLAIVPPVGYPGGLVATEVEKLATYGNSGVIALVDTGAVGGGSGTIELYAAGDGASFWGGLVGAHLRAAMDAAGIHTPVQDTWNVATAPDDPNFWAVVTGDNTTAGAEHDYPVNVWVTTNAGASWENTGLATITGDLEIGCIDVSPNYGGKRDIAVGVRDGALAGALRIYVVQSGGFTGWKPQTVGTLLDANGVAAGNSDVIALKFSPTYVGDASIAIMWANAQGTFYNIAIRDLSALNDITSWAFVNSPELKTPTNPYQNSPTATQIITGNLQLPSDFSGQSASLRRAYFATDDGMTDNVSDTGIYRVDDTTVYVLMDTSNSPANGKRIHSIAYYGTYASGKLLAGEVNGYACTATVPTWFTDSPTVCPVPCWYPALKPTTGAAGIDCTAATINEGFATVIWSKTGNLAYAGTSSLGETNGNEWWSPLDNAPVQYDETAIGVSRNNGETWNEIAFIDTFITKFTDVVVTADCQTIFLASLNDLGGADNCTGFDSVWRSTMNSKIAAPLPSMFPLGFFWERIFTHVNAVNCTVDQSDNAILRLPPPGANCDNGMVIGWAAVGTHAQAWSPDYGDYWANINPRNNIADFAFESPTIIYDLSDAGLVQKMPYTGTAWSTAEADSDTTLGGGHTIVAQAEGKVLVGNAAGGTGAGSPAAISLDGAKSFIPVGSPLSTVGNVHVAFDTAFDTSKSFFIADDSAVGTVYRVPFPPMGFNFTDQDMMSATNGACGAYHPVGQFGLQVAITGGALYSAHAPEHEGDNSGVDRALWPLSGLPKPGMVWDCLLVVNPSTYNSEVVFTAEPSSLKICGCCTMDTNTKLWALDNRDYIPYVHTDANGIVDARLQGFLWGFEDCLAKKGPALITKDGELIGCDPVSGRAQEVNLCWEQLCVADGYDIEIAKDKTFNIRVLDWAGTCSTTAGDFYRPVNVLSPCAFFPAGGEVTAAARIGSALAASGNLECGHQYFWRIQVRKCATGTIARSQWSEIRSFTIKAGLPVRADYYGLKLLSPDNGCLGCPVKPASFSWSPNKETTKYKFVLAKDAALTNVVAEAEVPTTAYEYNGTLDYSTNYFWRVMSLEPAPSDWSATFSFQTEAAPAAPAAPAEAPATPMWVWVIIAIGAILVIVTLVLIFKTRRV